MRIDRSASFLLALAVGVALTFAGCGSSSDTVQASPEVEKKTQDMLLNMQKKMQEQHKAAPGNGAKKGR